MLIDVYQSSNVYGQVGAARDAYKGRKAWIPQEAPKGLRVARLGIPADLILGSIGRRSLEDIAGMEVSNIFDSFFDKFTAEN